MYGSAFGCSRPKFAFMGIFGYKYGYGSQDRCPLDHSANPLPDLRAGRVQGRVEGAGHAGARTPLGVAPGGHDREYRSEEHTSELQSLMRISYAVFCLKKKKAQHMHNT